MIAGLYRDGSRRAKSLPKPNIVEGKFASMPRPFVFRIVIGIVLIVAALVALSRVDPTKAPKTIEKPVPENALAK
jgi:hypothetical protein